MTIQDRLHQHKEEIIEYIKQGYSTKQLGKIYDCNSGSIWFFLRDNNIKGNYFRSKNYGTIEGNKDKIIDMFNKGYSAYKIGKSLDISRCTILRLLQKYDCNTSRYYTIDKTKPLLKDVSEEVINLYKGGMSQQKISKKLKYSNGGISRLLSKHDVEIRPTNTYTVKDDYFDNIDTENKAYILGWWFADGNVMKAGKVRIAIQMNDRAIIDWMKDELQYTGPLYNRLEREGNRQDMIELCINRQKLASGIRKFGCVENKSLILQFPFNIPEHLYPHFIRGHFDGDGSITYSGITITSSYKFVHQLKSILPCDITNIYQRYKQKPKEKSAHQLFIGRNVEKQKFLSYIYTPSCVCLARKYDKAASLGFELPTVNKL